MKIISTTDGVSKGLSFTFKRMIPVSPKMVTNLDVKKKYIDMLSKHLSSGVVNEIIKLINKERIVPVECTEDFIRMLNKNLKGDACMNAKEYENVLGFYTSKQNRLYILMDNVQRLMGAGSLPIMFTTVHELQHMYCFNFTSEFIKLWENELYSFYGYFCACLYKAYTGGFRSAWNSLTGKDKTIVKNLLEPDNGIKYLVQYLIYNHEYLYSCAGCATSATDCKAIGEKFGMLLEQCGCESGLSAKIATKIAVLAKDIFSGKIAGTWRSSDNATIINCFREAYVRVFSRDPWKDNTLIYQELIFPSEIISVSSQYYYKHSKYYKFLGSL